MSDSTTRFSNRVENYVKWRPSYPSRLIPALQRLCGLAPSWRIADVGSGPGNLTRLLLDFGASVAGVEPNKRCAKKATLSSWAIPLYDTRIYAGRLSG